MKFHNSLHSLFKSYRRYKKRDLHRHTRTSKKKCPSNCEIVGGINKQLTVCKYGIQNSSCFKEESHSATLSATFHYANTPMQYTAIFQGCKNVYFQMNFFNIFLIFAQNIDCEYTLETPQ